MTKITNVEEAAKFAHSRAKYFLKKKVRKEMRKMMSGEPLQVPNDITGMLAAISGNKLDTSPDAMRALVDVAASEYLRDAGQDSGICQVVMIAQPDSPRLEKLRQSEIPVLK